MKDLLKHLENRVKERGSLTEACPPGLLRKITKSKTCREGIERLLEVDADKGLPSLIGRGKNIIELYQDDAWQVSLVRQALFPVEPFLVSSPNPILGCCVGGRGSSELVFYRIKGDTRALSAAGAWRLVEDHVETIKAGDLFSCNDPDLVMDFRSLSPTHIFLRFVHKPVAPLLFVFERDSKRFSYHTFSDEVATGHLFFADLIFQMFSEPDCSGRMTEAQRKDILAFCNRKIGDEGINMKARWRLLQALGLADEAGAVAWLKKFSSHPDPGVSRLAVATLAQLSEEGEQA